TSRSNRGSSTRSATPLRKWPDRARRGAGTEGDVGAGMPRRLAPALVLALVGCIEPVGTVGPLDDPPLADYHALVEGAPPNEDLPDENKPESDYQPQNLVLVGFQSPVRSQGQRGTCSIFATGALM